MPPPDSTAGSTGAASAAGHIPTGVAFTSRSHVPALGMPDARHAAVRERRPPVSPAPRGARRPSRALRARASATTTARAAPPVPTTAHAHASKRDAAGIDRIEKPVDVGVARHPAAAGHQQRVRGPAPASRFIRLAGLRSASVLNGAVTLAPATPIASANALKSATSRAANGR